jgi:hypothetical protein
MKLRDQYCDAQLRRALRNLEAKGLIWSEIDANCELRWYATVRKPKPANPDWGNVTTIGNAARKRRREQES